MFPWNVVSVIKARLPAFMPPTLGAVLEDHVLLTRPVRVADYKRCIAIYPFDWAPDLQSMEMGGGPPEYTVQRYNFRVQLMLKHGMEEEGLSDFNVQNARLRAILVRDTTLQVQLAALQVVLLGSTERFQKYRVTGQRFMSNEFSDGHIFLSVTNCYVETETTQN